MSSDFAPHRRAGSGFVLAACAVSAFVFSQPAMARSADPAAISAGPAMEAQAEASGLSPLEQRLLRKGFVDVRTLDPTIIVELKYARTDNFMGINAYGDFSRAYLLPEAARKLARANEILRERYPGLRILVADALRPRSVQHEMWKHVVDTPMQPYVANPYSGSLHNYGGAVDVTLYDVEAEEALDMGTPLDYFGPLAQPRLEARFLRDGKLSEEQIASRLILRKVMVEAGWHVLAIEWWHFEAFSREHLFRNYPIVE
jgi:zinc D-Ala-D-Ala dipeptidase